MRLDGRTALVTGASLGIGRAVAAAFATAGADVALVARRADVLEQAAIEIRSATGRTVLAISADVANGDDCARVFAAAEKGLGRIDVLVNNAGTSRTGRFLEVTDAVWQQDLDLKLFAAIRLARLAMPGMITRRHGRIINVLNTGAKAPAAGSAPTSVSRAAGMALTKVLAGEGAPHNVLVNALLVGRIESDQWMQRHATAAAAGSNRSLGDFYADMGKNIPMGRVGSAAEFANAALFLASDAGSYITGTAINVDGGLCPVV